MNYSTGGCPAANTGENNSLSVIQEFENKIDSVLKDAYHRYDPDKAVFLAAVSGGADSTAMLSALSVLIPQDRLFCLHVEHGLRQEKESKGDAEFVRSFCEKRGINFQIKTIAPGKIDSFSRRRGTGIEAAARFFRRKLLLREAERLGENTIILTAHTKDDAMELALMRIFRGAGPAGLAAMPVKKERFLRPLLSVSRAGVINYLTEKKIPWREDSTNTDEKFLRNKIRRRLVPLLDEFFPSWKKGLTGLAETQSITAAFISDEAQRRICWERESSALFTDSENFFSQPQIIREEALFQGIDMLLTGKSSVSVKRSIVRRFCAGSVYTADLSVLRQRRLLRLIRKNTKVLLCFTRNNYFETGFSLLINKPGLYNLNRVGIEVSGQDVRYSPEREESKRSFGSFYACLPLVFRRSFRDDFIISKKKKIACREMGKNIITGADMYGAAVFINKTEILFTRDFISEKSDETVYLVKLFRY